MATTESIQKLNHELGQALVKLEEVMANRSWPYVDLAFEEVKKSAAALTADVGPWVDPKGGK